jgi:hypothetical protein
MLHGLLGPVFYTEKPLCVDDGTDTGAARIHVSKSAPLQQELAGREECQHLCKVSVLNTKFAINTYVVLGRVLSPLTRHATNKAQCMDRHRIDHLLQVYPPWGYFRPGRE